MSAAETIAAAIEKLEHLRDAAADEDGVSWDVHSPNTGALIVTLHGTIDAQLAALRNAREDIVEHGDSEMTAERLYRAELALARAILGEAS